jgi:hypothetical protein
MLHTYEYEYEYESVAFSSVPVIFQLYFNKRNWPQIPRTLLPPFGTQSLSNTPLITVTIILTHLQYAFLNLGTLSTHFFPDKNNSLDCHPRFKMHVRTDVYVPVDRLLTINNYTLVNQTSSGMFKQRQFEGCAKSSQPKATKICSPFPATTTGMQNDRQHGEQHPGIGASKLWLNRASIYCSVYSVNPAPSGQDTPFKLVSETKTHSLINIPHSRLLLLISSTVPDKVMFPELNLQMSANPYTLNLSIPPISVHHTSILTPTRSSRHSKSSKVSILTFSGAFFAKNIGRDNFSRSANSTTSSDAAHTGCYQILEDIANVYIPI